MTDVAEEGGRCCRIRGPKKDLGTLFSLDEVHGPWTSLVAQMVKAPPAIWETWVRFLGWEDPLEKGMATHSSILAWIITWAEEPGRLQSMGSRRVGHDRATNTQAHSPSGFWKQR